MPGTGGCVPAWLPPEAWLSAGFAWLCAVGVVACEGGGVPLLNSWHPPSDRLIISVAMTSSGTRLGLKMYKRCASNGFGFIVHHVPPNRSLGYMIAPCRAT